MRYIFQNKGKSTYFIIITYNYLIILCNYIEFFYIQNQWVFYNSVKVNYFCLNSKLSYVCNSIFFICVLLTIICQVYLQWKQMIMSNDK